MKIQKPADAARIIKTRRLELGLTQQDLAEAGGITRQSLARIEKGNGGGAFETYLRVFELLNVSLETQLDSAVTSTRQTVTIELPSQGDLSTLSRIGSNAAEALTRRLSNQSFEEFRKHIGSLQHTLARGSGRLSRKAAGLEHLKSVIESSAPAHEAAATEHEAAQDSEQDSTTQTDSSQER